MPVTIDTIQSAARLIKGEVENTPLVHSRTLSAISGAEVYIKLENLQFTASFKERGALIKLHSLTEKEQCAGVIAMSAGNHAQAVAYHAQRLGIPATIVMPRSTPNVKVEHTRAFGAEVILHGDSFDEAAEFALQLQHQQGLVMVHPYDDEQVIAGQGTIALEMLKAHPELESLIIPVGGGGLIAGNAIAATSIKPGIEIIGVETLSYPSMQNSLDGKQRPFAHMTIAEGIAVKQPGKLTREIIQQHVSEILLVSEEQIEKSVLLLLEVEKTLAEGAGAAALAALCSHPDRFAGKKVGLILSGGNIDMPVLSAIIQRGLLRSQRMTQLHIELQHAPGILTGLVSSIENLGAAVIDIKRRTVLGRPLQNINLDITMYTRGEKHVESIVSQLRQQCSSIQVLTTEC